MDILLNFATIFILGLIIVGAYLSIKMSNIINRPKHHDNQKWSHYHITNKERRNK